MKKKKVIVGLMLVIGLVYLNNTTLLASPTSQEPELLAHRGLAQTFHRENLENDTCTAERIYKPEHPYLENTISSMKAAFEAGADLVEFDLKLTKDDQFAIFHDWTLDCRTDVNGKVSDYTMEELKSIDIGHGYTADGGKTYPFRGKGVGMMPSLDEVFASFPKESFLLNIKSDDPNEGKALAAYLKNLPKDRLSQLAVYGGSQPIDELEKELPELRTMSMDSLKSCLLSYTAVGWTGYVPQACEETQLHIPERFAPFLWGWPEKFVNRMENHHTRVILVAGKGKWSEGFDTTNDVTRIPSTFKGTIWTDRIDVIAPLYE
ncbi:glycerophosphodiester phosphodiesterase family protein [Metabacillus iocasae]|uniref:Glycerophosphoryl diester phosphodiesterase n=1 Tax=Priestia iocasae TaxID=2291674 RepID=A0ABS2QV31_9BACI|nr:glycerophosphodiester phosphodiesterase family protein [Metabacillus iocasae]MBM7702847.1 glycerophosphoryl diester phosphodiesterase [Metabacillus iocasae]